MPLSTKRFVISTSALNSQGFRMLTEGANLDGFKKNPVLLWNHIRPEGNLKNQILPLGHWPAEHLQVNGDEISGIPFFDDKDEFAMSIFNKVEGGHIRMCSAGAKPIEISDDEADKLPGQEAPTVTKWSLQEASICDIGANPDSLVVALYDNDDKLITLGDTSGWVITLADKSFKHLTKKPIMNKNTTTALAALKKAKEAKAASAKAIQLAADKVAIALADDTTSEEDATKLADENDEVKEMSDDDKDQQIEQLRLKLAEAEKALADMQDQKAQDEQKETDDKACRLADVLHAQGKITLAMKPDVIELAKVNYDGTKKLYDKVKPSQSITRQLNSSETVVETKDQAKLKKLSDMTWRELFNEPGGTQFLKLNAPDVYKAKFKAEFGKEPKNM